MSNDPYPTQPGRWSDEQIIAWIGDAAAGPKRTRSATSALYDDIRWRKRGETLDRVQYVKDLAAKSGLSLSHIQGLVRNAAQAGAFHLTAQTILIKAPSQVPKGCPTYRRRVVAKTAPTQAVAH